jgi:hypothetical protein
MPALPEALEVNASLEKTGRKELKAVVQEPDNPEEIARETLGFDGFEVETVPLGQEHVEDADVPVEARISTAQPTTSHGRASSSSSGSGSDYDSGSEPEHGARGTGRAAAPDFLESESYSASLRLAHAELLTVNEQTPRRFGSRHCLLRDKDGEWDFVLIVKHVGRGGGDTNTFQFKSMTTGASWKADLGSAPRNGREHGLVFLKYDLARHGEIKEEAVTGLAVVSNKERQRPLHSRPTLASDLDAVDLVSSG